MLGARQRHRVFTYLRNAATRLHCREDSARDLMEWVSEHARLLEFDAGNQVPPSSRRGLHRTALIDSELTPAAWTAVRGALQNGVDATRRARPDLVLRRLRRLADIAGLSRSDVRILEFLLLYETDPVVESMVDDIFRSAPHGKRINAANPVLSVILDLSFRTVTTRFGPNAPLVRSGLVEVDYDGDLSLAQRLQRLAFVPGSGTDVRDLLLKAPEHPELDWSDFEHVAEDADHVARLLEGALRTGEPGVNILLYGPPGTGKTQFCRTVAERLGAPCSASARTTTTAASQPGGTASATSGSRTHCFAGSGTPSSSSTRWSTSCRIPAGRRSSRPRTAGAGPVVAAAPSCS